MATTAMKTDQYIQDVQKFIQIDMDKVGNVICELPSTETLYGIKDLEVDKALEILENSERHSVHVDSKTTVPYPFHCSCEGVSKYHVTTCRHMSAVGAYYARIYKSNVAKLKAKSTERTAQINTQIEASKKRVAGGQYGADKGGVERSMMNASLGGTKAFNMMR